MSYYYSGFPRYVFINEKCEKARKKLKQLKKKNPNIEPLILKGTKLVNTWWGIAWNKNLEKYADYKNRIGRGCSYIRNGFVLDFQIRPEGITSLVQESSSRPYEVAIMFLDLNILNK